MRWFWAWLLHRVMGFSTEETVEQPDKFVIALAPHTSNWDFLLGMLFCWSTGFHCNFIMKSEWFFWPVGGLMRKLGGIPVRRDRRNNLTSQLAAEARRSKQFRLCITPEGTRKLQTRWKSGFYYIALEAGIPILLYGLDYKRKLLCCTKIVYPTGDAEREISEIKQYFADFTGKHPKQFTTGV